MTLMLMRAKAAAAAVAAVADDAASLRANKLVPRKIIITAADTTKLLKMD